MTLEKFRLPPGLDLQIDKIIPPPGLELPSNTLIHNELHHDVQDQDFNFDCLGKIIPPPGLDLPITNLNEITVPFEPTLTSLKNKSHHDLNYQLYEFIYPLGVILPSSKLIPPPGFFISIEEHKINQLTKKINDIEQYVNLLTAKLKFATEQFYANQYIASQYYIYNKFASNQFPFTSYDVDQSNNFYLYHMM